MRRIVLATVAASIAAFSAAISRPVSADPAMHLAWDDCGAWGATLKQFACDSNTGSQRLIVSFVPPPGITNFEGLEVVIQLVPGSGTVPDWWRLQSTGCRTSSLHGSVDLEGVVNDACVSPYGPSRGGGAIASIDNTLKFVGAQNPPGPLDAGTEYFAGAITIDRAKSTGAGACAGCEAAMALELESLRLTMADNSVVDLPNYRGTGVVSYVSWQCNGQPVLFHDFQYGWVIERWEFPGCPTAVRRPSWGGIKSLYR